MLKLLNKINGYLENETNLTEKYIEIMQKKVWPDSDVKAFLKDNQAQLTPEIIKRGESKLYEFVLVKNQLAQGQATMTPGYTPSLVLNNQRIEVVYTPTAEFLEKQRQLEIKKRIRFFNNRTPKHNKLVRFKDITTNDNNPSRSIVFAKMMDFLNHYIEKPYEFHKGLYLYGSFGTGKTFFMTTLANELAIRGYSSLIVYYPEFVRKMKDAINNGQTTQLLNELCDVPILIFDEIGSIETSNWVRDECLAIVLQARMEQELPTFFTSNLSLDELQQALEVNNRDISEPLKAQRLMERIKFLADECAMIGKNWRNS